MAVGLKAAGYEITFANDFNKYAVAAYRHNLGDYVIQGDVKELFANSQIPRADVYAGGPPCQDYSVAGNSEGEDGDRGKLVWTYLDTIASNQPKAFVFENVKGLILKKHRATFEALLAKFDEIGYNVSWRLINAWDYGVAQKRERVFVVGIRKDLEITFKFPESKPEDYRTQTLRDVIGDLLEPGGQDLGTFYMPPKKYSYEQSNRVMQWDGPSNTIPAHHNTGQPIHPERGDGRFTVRECLRIQSVPDWYRIPDGMSLGQSYKIVGNGVASRVSYLIGVALAEQLNAVLTENNELEAV
jgi:DNA (cytosine-5)-methyltransferase 1